MLNRQPSRTSEETPVLENRAFESRFLREIAKVEARTWHFRGQPVVKTIPSVDETTGRASSFPDAYILLESGEFERLTHSGQSRLPGWHPAHLCSLYCDGQDGSITSECAAEKRRGPPRLTPIEEFTRQVWDDGITTGEKRV